MYAYNANNGVKNADFPGVRMTPAEGEADTWTYTLTDVENYTHIVFARISEIDNHCMAKSADLAIADAGDNNRYTITSTEGRWAILDQTAEGEWSYFSTVTRYLYVTDTWTSFANLYVWDMEDQQIFGQWPGRNVREAEQVNGAYRIPMTGAYNSEVRLFFHDNEYSGDHQYILDIFNLTTDKTVTTVPLTIDLGAAGYATFSASFNFTVSNATAYKASVAGNVITLTALNGVIPANTGVILHGENNATATITFTPGGVLADVTGNVLRCTCPDKREVQAGDHIYCLTKNTNEFNKVSSGVTIPLYKAYFSLAADVNSTGSAPLRIALPEEVATGIDGSTTLPHPCRKALIDGRIVVIRNGAIFDLNGMVRE